MLGSLLVSLGLDSGEFRSGLTATEKQLRASTKRIEALGKSMGDIGQKMSVAVTLPLIALSTKAVQGFQDQQQAMAQVNAALTSMGDVSGKTADELSKTADALEMNSLVDADVILKQVTANLLTFGNVAGAQFDRAQQSALDMAQRLGGEPQAAAIMLGKALNDPIKGITALTRVGVQFTEAQKSQIKAMAESGRTAEAQGIILTEVERQFKGAAKTAAETSPWRQAQVAFGQASDVLGEVLLPAITQVAGAIKIIAQGFAELPRPLQQGIVALGAIAAVLGPVLVGLGAMTTAMAPFLSVLGAAFSEAGLLVAAKAALVGLGAALGPILVPLAALGAAATVIYLNWEKIAPVLLQTWEAAKTAIGPAFTELVNSLKVAFQEISDTGLFQAIGEIGLALLKAFGGALPGVLRTLSAIIVGVVQVITDAVRVIVDLFSGDYAGALRAAEDLCRHFVTAVGNALGGLAQAAISFISSMVRSINEWLGGKLAQIFNGVLDKIQTVKKGFFDLYDAVVGHSYIPDMVDGIAAQMLRLDAAMVDQAGKVTNKTKEAFQKLAEDLKPLLDRLFPDAAALNQYQADLKTLANAAKAGMISSDQEQAARNRLAQEGRPTDSAIPLILADPVIQEMDKINDAVDGMKRKSETASVAIAKTFADMARDTVGAFQSMANAIKGGGIVDILSSVINLGLQLGSIGVFGKGVSTRINTPRAVPSVPAFANGTNFAPGGMALVGERGPEIVNLPRGSQVIPNEALGGSRVQIVPSPYFTAIVDGRVQSGLQTATPLLIGASVAETGARAARSQSRRVG